MLTVLQNAYTSLIFIRDGQFNTFSVFRGLKQLPFSSITCPKNLDFLILLEEIVWTYGKLAQIVDDNGEECRSKEFQAVCRRYEI